MDSKSEYLLNILQCHFNKTTYQGTSQQIHIITVCLEDYQHHKKATLLLYTLEEAQIWLMLLNSSLNVAQ